MGDTNDKTLKPSRVPRRSGECGTVHKRQCIVGELHRELAQEMDKLDNAMQEGSQNVSVSSPALGNRLSQE